jgi:putative flippase GtrA
LIKVRFLTVGVWNTIFALSMFYTLLKVFDSTSYQLLLVICFLVANIQSHFMQRTFVWKSKDPYIQEIFRFLVSAVTISLLNFLLLVLFVEVLDYQVFETQVTIALAITSLNFFLQKRLVFKLEKK